MKDLSIIIISLIIVFLLTTKTEISFNPFKVSFNDIYQGIGIVLLVFSLACFHISSYRKGNLEGHREAFDYIRKEINTKK